MEMTEKKQPEAVEGRRERKRRQTRERIEQAAMTLFLERGFDATTIEEITEAADVSKRSFFDYFPSKEEVVFAWQDSFADRLMAAIAARPAAESSVKAVEEALIVTVTASAKVTVNASTVAISAGMVTVDAGMSKFSGVVQADTVISNSVISASYTPGAGNIW